ncbi:hypothetical protein K7X08_037840 [Anisodus acutangulus]|uniref:NB-ARC domain containing protein n=1 Tax=Anisodus acutangulus TaxID=402998 RepID=A0A9Q1RT06_9SOLA|nr:hypothetical protein K7X08_037840 [Anisodus acutangulus]
MLSKANPITKSPMVTINTSDHDVPSQSLKSFVEQIGDSRQQLIFKGNDNNLVKGTSSISQANSINNLFVSKEKQGKTSAPRWADLVEEEEQSTSPPRRLSPNTTYDIDLGDDRFDENDMLDICFDKVAKDGDLSQKQQRSECNKIKRKTHGKQHSWDDKVTEEFVLRNLSMPLAKQNHMTVSTTSTRYNKCKKW